ncbi:hypothetical protein KUTeg_022848 [Tegillarca granosa]|uniref:B box-type domain-containing protein n=1 Tax=Tegillarca granosa TaxID=220873 RepID=A0ABQ9E002_TEGGR|nr:hypothetical protein KUTeg_022848 [Tegillarca granosa]
MAESAKFEALCTVMLGQKCGLMLGQKCGLCEINNTSYKCLNCDKKICITCMKIHLKSKASSDHKIEGLQSEDVYENIWKPEDLFRRRRFHMWEAGRGIPPLSQERNNQSASHAINVKIAGSFNSDKSRVVTTGNDQAWLWCMCDTDISLVTSDGKTIQNIKTDFEISDAAVSKSGRLLVTEFKGDKVKKLRRNNTFKDIYTAADDYETQSITVTDTGKVLVVLHNYYKNSDGKFVQYLMTPEHGCDRPVGLDIDDSGRLYNFMNMAKSEECAAQCPVIFDQKCELCDINNTSYKCLNCDEMMCKTCMKIHLKSKATKDHKMASLQSAEIDENRDLTEKKCSSHTKEDLTMFCNTCDYPICRECVTSGTHLNHSMVKVEEVIDIKQKQLSRIIRQTNKKSKKYQDVIKIITQNKSEFSLSIAKQIKEVKSRNKELKQKLDKIESNYIQELQNKDKENNKAMTELEQRLQGEMSDMNHLIQQCQHKQKDGNIEMVKFVTDVRQKVDKYQSCDIPDPVSPPKLITRSVDAQELEDLFGQLGMMTAQTVILSIQHNRNISSASLDMDVKIVSSFNSDKTHVVTTGNDQAWLWCWGGRDISLVTSNGKVLQNIKTDFEISDAAVSKSGDLLVTACIGNKKYLMVNIAKATVKHYTVATDNIK